MTNRRNRLEEVIELQLRIISDALEDLSVTSLKDLSGQLSMTISHSLDRHEVVMADKEDEE